MAHAPPEQSKLDWQAFLHNLLRFASVLILLLLGGTVLLFAGLALVSIARANQESAERDLERFQTALRLYHSKYHCYPSPAWGLRELLDSLELDWASYDPWGHPYGYELREDQPRVWSLGADGAPGGEGEDADIFLPREP
ncbi:general secretion pathway protein G [Cystobacter fuscus DSM 2262]|uniref:General secretion pathway protein G n=1 Tax=Cystobacter fuscus (strain ATCC 25194 / DSM 2262 / NBRC 100088 / M29) TaxID=1242864 RepID=S9PB44_CYSF2|nr:type II secretion system protein GspG [Cystobacter fuscus]EPX61600.1 general secretion pathway protein G [Cystobacter fuscus DSM 2262]